MPMGMHSKRPRGARAKVLIFALALCTTVFARVVPAQADSDTTENHLCQDTGAFGYYGVSDHVHITDTSGTYHISTFGQASAWAYFGTGAYCTQSSTTMPCTSEVWLDVYQNGFYLTSTGVY